MRLISRENPDEGANVGATWLSLVARGKLYRYYLGQIGNKKCFEARRKLRSALKSFFNESNEVPEIEDVHPGEE